MRLSLVALALACGVSAACAVATVALSGRDDSRSGRAVPRLTVSRAAETVDTTTEPDGAEGAVRTFHGTFVEVALDGAAETRSDVAARLTDAAGVVREAQADPDGIVHFRVATPDEQQTWHVRVTCAFDSERTISEADIVIPPSDGIRCFVLPRGACDPQPRPGLVCLVDPLGWPVASRVVRRADTREPLRRAGAAWELDSPDAPVEIADPAGRTTPVDAGAHPGAVRTIEVPADPPSGSGICVDPGPGPPSSVAWIVSPGGGRPAAVRTLGTSELRLPWQPGPVRMWIHGATGWFTASGVVPPGEVIRLHPQPAGAGEPLTVRIGSGCRRPPTVVRAVALDTGPPGVPASVVRSGMFEELGGMDAYRVHVDRPLEGNRALNLSLFPGTWRIEACAGDDPVADALVSVRAADTAGAGRSVVLAPLPGRVTLSRPAGAAGDRLSVRFLREGRVVRRVQVEPGELEFAVAGLPAGLCGVHVYRLSFPGAGGRQGWVPAGTTVAPVDRASAVLIGIPQ